MIFKPASFRLWNFWAPYYEKLWVQSVSLTPTRRAVMQQVSAWIHSHQAHQAHTAQSSSPAFPKLRILDVGCGTGQLLRDIRRAFPHLPLELTGVDYAPAMIAQAQALESGETRPITYACLTAQELDQLPQPYHLILCTHSFPYYPDQRKALDQFRQALVPGGHVIMAQAAGVTLYDRFVLFFVKWTTGAALYPSEPAVRQLIHYRFQLMLVRPLREKWFMPTILLFHLKEAAQ
ncbi:class I SAM-dependent methyltransferase [Anoxynatronum sibiricum]|uniref:Class I SAM-dependent methyltransferase n=1 Tax=Anoxynatronum sibiricum TaxID=210623 RepID=A0ABU9VTJ2_9CLOT